AAVEAWFAAFEAWLRAWRQTEQPERVRREARSKQVHVLLLGRPLHRPRVKDRLKAFLKDNLPFRGANVYFHQNADRLVGGGAGSFLPRTAQGRPTWEAWLPDLYLQVRDGARLRDLCIFQARTARPGQPIVFAVPEELELPPHRPDYPFPLVRDRQSRQRLSYRARLRSPQFPLDRATPVRMEVSYRYGEDSFRLVVRPSDPAATPLRPIEMEWARGAERAEVPAPCNLPPEFPDAEPWDESLSEPIHRLAEAIRNLQSQAPRAFSFNPSDADGLGQAIM